MPTNNSNENNSSHHGHLGLAWEIAVAAVFVLLVLAIGVAVVFQYRRKQRRRQQAGVGGCVDIEGGRQRRGPVKGSEKHRERSSTALEPAHPRDSTTNEGRASVGTDEGGSGPIKLPPAAQQKRSSKSSYQEYISQKPPKYYWDQR